MLADGDKVKYTYTLHPPYGLRATLHTFGVRVIADDKLACEHAYDSECPVARLPNGLTLRACMCVLLLTRSKRGRARPLSPDPLAPPLELN